MCEFQCFPLIFWRCRAHEARPLFHPVAACQSEPSAKAAEERKQGVYFKLKYAQFLSTSKLVQCHARSSPWCHRLQTCLQCPNKRKCILLKNSIIQNDSMYPNGGGAIFAIHLHINRFSRGSSFTLNTHEGKCGENYVISICMDMYFWGISLIKITFSPCRPRSPLSPCKKQTNNNKWVTVNISFFVPQLNINPITILPSFLVHPKHTETEVQEIVTCICNAWHGIKLAIPIHR